MRCRSGLLRACAESRPWGVSGSKALRCRREPGGPDRCFGVRETGTADCVVLGNDTRGTDSHQPSTVPYRCRCIVGQGSLHVAHYRNDAAGVGL